MNPLLQHWYFHLPNFVLAAAMYTVLGRLVLSFFVRPDWQNYIWRAFVRITEPFVAVVRFLTPVGVPDPVVMVFTFLWLMVARLVLVMMLGANMFAVGAGG
jgi:uncharacterized protein YggT (Ycf19 family)